MGATYAEPAQPRGVVSELGAPNDRLKPGPGRPAALVAAHQRARIHGAVAEIVGEQGYGALKVREVVKLAGLSSRAFYESFTSKEDAFLSTHEVIARRATSGLAASQMGGRNWRERPRLIYAAFARELERDPNTARLAMIEVYSAGPEALEQAHRTECTFEAMIAESFASARNGIAVPSLVIEGMVAGVARVARVRLQAGREGELPGLGGELMEWALCFPGKSAGGLSLLDGRSMSMGSTLDLNVKAFPHLDDRATILAAVGKLAASNGYGNLTVPHIRAGAGVSRATFDTHFEGVEDCFLAALELRSDEVIARAASARADGARWSGGIYRGISSLCDQIIADPILISLCLADDFAPGSAGSLCRLRLVAAVAEQFRDSAPTDRRLGDLAAEASAGAIWALFHHHIVRGLALRQPQIAATLSFMALAPSIGDSAAVAAIGGEQTP